MGDLNAGETFTDNSPGNAVNAARLNNHVGGATIAPAAISGKADIGTGAVTGDFALIYQASSGTLKKVSLANLYSASNQVWVSPTAPPTSYQDTNHVWIRTNPSNPIKETLLFWNATSSSWQRVYSVPVGTVTGTTDTSNFDSTGLGTGAFVGWALCNGNTHGGVVTANYATPSGGPAYMQFIGDIT